MTPLRRCVSSFASTRLLSTTAAVRGEVAHVEPDFPTEAPHEEKTKERNVERLSAAQENAHLSFMDPFESLPLRKLATYLGETFSPKLEEIQATERERVRPKAYTEVTEPPSIPHFLPLTRWASHNKQVRETLVVDEQQRPRVRLSWYHPDDTMVPRGWFSKGLLEDIKYYRPFLNQQKKKE